MERVKTSRIFDTLYFCFFIFLPFTYFDKLVDPVLIPRQTLLTLFVFLLTLIISYKVYEKKLIADFSFLKLGVFMALGLFLISVLISFSKSIALSESKYLLSKLALEALFFILTTYLLIQNQLNRASLIKSIMVFCILVVVQCIFQVIKLTQESSDFFDNMLNVTATFGHKNLLASILFLTIPFLLASTETKRGWKITGRICVVLILLMAWLLQSKAIIITSTVFMAIFVFLLIRNRGVNNHFIKVGGIATLLLIVLAGLFTVLNKEKFPRIFDKKSSFERLGLWENSKYMITDNFFLGVGAGNWQVHFPKYGMDRFSEPEVKNGITTFQRPHNDFLWIFCEMGLIGFIAYVSIFIVISYYLFCLFKNKQTVENARLYPAIISAVSCYLLIAFVDFPLERIEHQVMLLLLFSIVTAHYYTFLKKPMDSKIILNPSLIFLFFLLPILFSFVVCSKRWKGEFHTQRLYFFERNANWGQMHKEAKAAVNIYYTMDPMSAPIEWYNGVALFSSNDLSAAKNCFENAYAINPYNMHVINNLASCYESTGDHKRAEELYLDALNISSEFEEARLNLSAVYYNKKEFEKAFETIDKCDVNSKDPKHKLFLKAILSSWVENLLIKEKDAAHKQRLTTLKHGNEDLTLLYLESKKKEIDFKTYIQTNSR